MCQPNLEPPGVGNSAQQVGWVRSRQSQQCKRTQAHSQTPSRSRHSLLPRCDPDSDSTSSIPNSPSPPKPRLNLQLDDLCIFLILPIWWIIGSGGECYSWRSSRCVAAVQRWFQKADKKVKGGQMQMKFWLWFEISFPPPGVTKTPASQKEMSLPLPLLHLQKGDAPRLDPKAWPRELQP